jgi:hypothetical protein
MQADELRLAINRLDDYLSRFKGIDGVEKHLRPLRRHLNERLDGAEVAILDKERRERRPDLTNARVGRPDQVPPDATGGKTTHLTQRDSLELLAGPPVAPNRGVSARATFSSIKAARFRVLIRLFQNSALVKAPA